MSIETSKKMPISTVKIWGIPWCSSDGDCEAVSLWLLTRTVKEDITNPKFDLIGDLCRELGSSATSTVDCSNAKLAKAVTGATFLILWIRAFLERGGYPDWSVLSEAVPIRIMMNRCVNDHFPLFCNLCLIRMHRLCNKAVNHLFTIPFATCDPTRRIATHHNAGCRMFKYL